MQPIALLKGLFTARLPAVQSADPAHEISFPPFVVKLNALLLCGGIATILRAKSGKTRLTAAIVGTHPEILGIIEAMRDLGLDCKFFEGDPEDILHPSAAAEELSQCDVALVADHDLAREKNLLKMLQRTEIMPIVAIGQLLAAHLSVLQREPSINRSSLNPYKFSMIAAALVLTSPRGSVIECGVYMAGTTIYMALLQKALGIERKIYALDTFEGMPEPTFKDFGGGFVYAAGMFAENRIDVVRRILAEANVTDDIELVVGLCQDTLPEVLKDSEDIAFVLLDTDQYAGIKGGLDQIGPRLSNDSVVIVDDSLVHGVKIAIDEKMTEDSILYRIPLCTNFDAIFSRRLASAL